jgi:hypothetical protein
MHGFRKMNKKADELENERYDPIMESWLELQLHIHDFILEAFTNELKKGSDETSEMGDTPQP